MRTWEAESNEDRDRVNIIIGDGVKVTRAVIARTWIELLDEDGMARVFVDLQNHRDRAALGLTFEDEVAAGVREEGDDHGAADPEAQAELGADQGGSGVEVA